MRFTLKARWIQVSICYHNRSNKKNVATTPMIVSHVAEMFRKFTSLQTETLWENAAKHKENLIKRQHWE